MPSNTADGGRLRGLTVTRASGSPAHLVSMPGERTISPWMGKGNSPAACFMHGHRMTTTRGPAASGAGPADGAWSSSSEKSTRSKKPMTRGSRMSCPVLTS
jgi:hypothetical protein